MSIHLILNLTGYIEMPRKLNNLDQAELNKMSYNDKNMFCPWCQLPTFNAAPQYSLWVHLLELEDLGWGVPLYFYFQKYLLFVYLTMVLIVSIPATIIYSRENKAKQWKDTDDALWPIDLTLGNYGTDDNQYEDSSLNTVIILGIVTIVILYIMNFFFQNFNSKLFLSCFLLTFLTFSKQRERQIHKNTNI